MCRASERFSRCLPATSRQTDPAAGRLNGSFQHACYRRTSPRPAAPFDAMDCFHKELRMRSNRPLLPHLTWCRFQFTSVLSISTGWPALFFARVHALGGGSLRLSKTLAPPFASNGSWHPPVRLLYRGGWSVTFFFHLNNGIRHLSWDSGYGFDLKTAYRSGYAVLPSTAILSTATWAYVFWKAVS